MHLTETCDAQRPPVSPQVETTVSTDPAVTAVAAIHQALATSQLLPAEHRVDRGYASGETSPVSAQQFGVDRGCPVQHATRWPAHTPDGFDLAHFQVDWHAQHVTAGQRSRSWTTTPARHGKPGVLQSDRLPPVSRAGALYQKSDCRPPIILPTPIGVYGLTRGPTTNS